MSAFLPPRWFIRSAWAVQRGLYRLTDGRAILARPKPGGSFGMLRLRTVGRRTGEPRAVIVGYYEDGPNLVTLAMNGWGDPEPAWWLNLQSQPDAAVDTIDGARQVRARAAAGDERERLWKEIAAYKGYGDIVSYSTRRSRETAVVVLEPR